MLPMPILVIFGNTIKYDTTGGIPNTYNPGSSYMDLNNPEYIKSIGTGNYTISFSLILNSSSSSYIPVLLLSTTSTSNADPGMMVRFGDSGFGHKLLIGANTTTVNGSYKTTYGKSDFLSISHLVEIKRTNQLISVYIDGVKVNLSAGTGSTIVTEFKDSTDFNNLKYFRVGNFTKSSGIDYQIKNFNLYKS